MDETEATADALTVPTPGAGEKKTIVDIRLGAGKRRYLSRMTSIDIAHVSRVLNGKRDCSLTVAATLAKAAGVTLDQLYAYREARREATKRKLRALRVRSSMERVRSMAAKVEEP